MVIAQRGEGSGRRFWGRTRVPVMKRKGKALASDVATEIENGKLYGGYWKKEVSVRLQGGKGGNGQRGRLREERRNKRGRSDGWGWRRVEGWLGREVCTAGAGEVELKEKKLSAGEEKGSRTSKGRFREVRDSLGDGRLHSLMKPKGSRMLRELGTVLKNRGRGGQYGELGSFMRCGGRGPDEKGIVGITFFGGGLDS